MGWGLQHLSTALSLIYLLYSASNTAIINNVFGGEMMQPIGCDQARNAGFSLIELMVTVAVLAILLTIGVPSFQAQFEQSRFDAVRESMLTALGQARSEALTRGEPVELCRGGAGGCSDGQDWSSGWVLVTTGAASQVLQVWEAAAGASITLASGNRIRYRSDGSVAGTESITLVYGSRSMGLSVLATGAVNEN